MPFSNLKCNVHTRLMPMVGYPMEHSSASQVYNWLLEYYDINRVMFPVEIPKGHLQNFVSAAQALDIDIYGLTMPHKADIIPLLDEVDPCSRIFNSVNIVKTIEGKTYGIGMDGKGCVNALTEYGISLAGKTVMLLGAGSISGAIIYELIQKNTGSIFLLNRTFSNACHLADTVLRHFEKEINVFPNTCENLDWCASQADVIIHCSPVGMYGFPASHAYLGFLSKAPRHCVVLDAIVNPIQTPLLSEALQQGLAVIPGMEMMLSQMTEIFDFCFHVRPGHSEKISCRKILTDYLT